MEIIALIAIQTALRVVIAGHASAFIETRTVEFSGLGGKSSLDAQAPNSPPHFSAARNVLRLRTLIGVFMKPADSGFADPCMSNVRNFSVKPNLSFPPSNPTGGAKFAIVTTKSLMGGTPSEYLSVGELRDLTGSARALTQKRWLDSREVPNKLDVRRVIVSRIHVQAWLEGRLLKSSNGPNWNALK